MILLSISVSCDDAFAFPIWQKHLDGQIWSVDTSADGSHIAAGTDINRTAGKIYYFDKDGSLLWENEQDRIIGKVSVSEDGSRVLASGYQLTAGAGVAFINPSVYLFNETGNLLWYYQNTNKTSIPLENQSLSGKIIPQKKIIIQSNEEIMYLDYEGNLLWSYIVPGSMNDVKISEDGSIIAVGVTGNTDNTWWLYVFDNFGNVLWKYDGFDGFVQGSAVSISSEGERIAIGSMASGDYGNLYMFDNKGKLLWQRNVEGGILSIDISNNGTFTVVGSNLGTTIFDEHGNKKHTRPAYYTALSENSIVGSNVSEDHDNLIFFDTQLNPILGETIESTVGKISANSKQVVVGTRQQTESGNTGELYLFENNISDHIILSPLKQSKLGIQPDEITCKEGLELVMKKSNGQPICVKGTSVKTLTLRNYIPEYNGALGGEIPTELSIDSTGVGSHENIAKESKFPLWYRLSEAEKIVTESFGKLPITGVGVDIKNELEIIIHEDELKKFSNAKEYYEKLFKDMFPFEVPMRIEFGHSVAVGELNETQN